MKRTLITTLFFLALALPALPSAAQDGTLLEGRLLRTREQLGNGGSGLVARYQRGVGRLEDTLRKDEYLHLGRFVRLQILEPWREVNVHWILDLAADPPGQLNGQQQALLRHNGFKVRIINQRLRRVRRLVTRAQNLNAENRRRLQELNRTIRAYERDLALLEQINPDRAAGHRDWMEGQLLPRVESVRGRDEQLREKLDRLGHWSEESGLRDWLRRVGQVNRALDLLNRHYGMP